MKFTYKLLFKLPTFHPYVVPKFEVFGCAYSIQQEMIKKSMDDAHEKYGITNVDSIEVDYSDTNSTFNFISSLN
jgi:hypothetical protein